MGQMRRGIVVDGRGSQNKVQFQDHDGLISPWLDVAQQSTVGKKSFRRFAKGEHVRCFIDDNGETGEVLFAFYNDVNAAPSDGEAVFYEEAADGSKLEWGDGSFRYTSAGGAVLEVTGSEITVTGNLEISGDLKVNGASTLKDTTINGVAQSGD